MKRKLLSLICVVAVLCTLAVGLSYETASSEEIVMEPGMTDWLENVTDTGVDSGMGGNRFTSAYATTGYISTYEGVNKAEGWFPFAGTTYKGAEIAYGTFFGKNIGMVFASGRPWAAPFVRYKAKGRSYVSTALIVATGKEAYANEFELQESANGTTWETLTATVVKESDALNFVIYKATAQLKATSNYYRIVMPGATTNQPSTTYPGKGYSEWSAFVGPSVFSAYDLTQYTVLEEVPEWADNTMRPGMTDWLELVADTGVDSGMGGNRFTSAYATTGNIATQDNVNTIEAWFPFAGTTFKGAEIAHGTFFGKNIGKVYASGRPWAAPFVQYKVKGGSYVSTALIVATGKEAYANEYELQESVDGATWETLTTTVEKESDALNFVIYKATARLKGTSSYYRIIMPGATTNQPSTAYPGKGYDVYTQFIGPSVFSAYDLTRYSTLEDIPEWDKSTLRPGTADWLTASEDLSYGVASPNGGNRYKSAYATTGCFAGEAASRAESSWLYAVDADYASYADISKCTFFGKNITGYATSDMAWCGGYFQYKVVGGSYAATALIMNETHINRVSEYGFQISEDGVTWQNANAVVDTAEEAEFVGYGYYVCRAVVQIPENCQYYRVILPGASSHDSTANWNDRDAGENEYWYKVYIGPTVLSAYNLSNYDVLSDIPDFDEYEQLTSMGAQIRVQESKDLRFGFRLEADNVTYEDAYHTDGNYKRALTADSKVYVNGRAYTITDFGALLTVNGNENLDDVNVPKGVKKVSAQNLYSVNGYIIMYTVVIVDIAQENLDTKIYARPYVEYQDDSGRAQYLYGEKIDRSWSDCYDDGGDSFGSSMPKTPYFDVTHFGAKKDGSADASQAIQKALDAAAKEKGGIVYLPAGRYLMQAGVDVPMGVTVRGDAPSTQKKWRTVSDLGTATYSYESAGYDWLDAGNFAGTWIIVDHGAGNAESHATFQMQGNASIMGLGFVHKNTAPVVSKITAYPPAIGIVNTYDLPFTREGMTVENIVLLNAYIGVAFHAGNGKVLDHEIGTQWEGHLHSLGRMRVHNVTGGCAYRGMIFKGLLDTVDIQNVRFGYTNMEKTYATQRAQQCADFEWYRADGSSAKNIFSFGAKYGILTTPAYNNGSSSLRMSDAELIGQYPLYLTASGQYELTDCTFTTMNFNNLVTEKDFRAMTVIQDATSVHQTHNLFTNLKLVNKVQSASLNDYNLYIQTKRADAAAMMLFSDITFEGWSPDNTNAAVYYEAAGSSYIGYASFYNCTAQGGSSSAGRLFRVVNVPKGGLQFNKCTFPQQLVTNAGTTDSVWIQN